MKDRRPGTGGRWLCLTLAVALAACDKDPPVRPRDALEADPSVTPDVITRQGAISLVFNRPIQARTALDQSNFVVTNQCTGLRVPGSLRLGRDTVSGQKHDTLVFSPSVALPFLTPLAVRVQNILDARGQALRLPITFERTVEPPLVSDLTWSFLDSPTNDALTGIDFVDDNNGFLVAQNGTVYRTTNGGRIWGAIFKSIDITQTFQLRAASIDTLFMVGNLNQGQQTNPSALFRSTNGGLSFTAVDVFTGQASGMSLTRVGTGAGSTVVVIYGGTAGAGSVMGRYEAPSGLHQLATINAPEFFHRKNAISPDGTRALGAGWDLSVFPARRGSAVFSTDGGRTYNRLAIGVAPWLYGAAFVSNDVGLVFGDSSIVMRVAFGAGAPTVTRVTSGIPQTTVSPANDTTVYQFEYAAFAPGGQTGWLVGRRILARPNAPAQQTGIILQTLDGGLNWTRQGITGAPDNGLGFPAALDVRARSATDVATAGAQGLVAGRRGTPSTTLAACSFNTPGGTTTPGGTSQP